MSEERNEKNQVFGPQGPVAPAQPAPVAQQVPQSMQQSALDIVRAEFGLEIPVAAVPLPSNGKVYPVGSPLHNCQEVEIRAMTALEEDILTSQALLKKGTVVTELIKSCLLDKQINPASLLAGDRNALMVSIRITGYDRDYEAEVACGECGVNSQRSFDLGLLPIKRLELEPVEPGKNVFEFMLPYTKKRVKFRFMTGNDEEEIMATHERQKKLGLASDALVTTNLLYSIVSIEGIEDRNKIAQFTRLMPARDSLALRTYIRENEPGIKMRQEVSCPSCGYTEDVSMPLGVKFLWPNAE